jgi:hypothetical protein
MKKIIGNFGNELEFAGDDNLEVDPDSMLDLDPVGNKENLEAIKVTDNGFLCLFKIIPEQSVPVELTGILFDYKRTTKQTCSFYVTKEMLERLTPFDKDLILKSITFLNNNKIHEINTVITKFSYKFYGSLPLCVIEF